MIQKIKMILANFLFSSIGLREQLHALHVKQKVNSYQLDFLILNSDRKIRKKWNRMLTNKNSPFYLGNFKEDRVLANKYRISTGSRKFSYAGMEMDLEAKTGFKLPRNVS